MGVTKTALRPELERARKGAAHLYARGARKVWLFGSVAKGRRPDARSDLDLAVEGLPSQLYFRLISELNDLLGCPVDLVEKETASPALLAEIERHQILLANEN